MSADRARTRRPALRPELPADATLKVVGLGGVGSIAARYLALLLVSMRTPVRLVLIDGDDFEERNGTRMVFHRLGPKAEVVGEELLPLVRDSNVDLTVVRKYLTPASIARLVCEGDHVLLAVDNHATRKLVSDHCSSLRDVCVISGGNDGVGSDAPGSERRGTYGNVQVLLRRDGRWLTPDLARLHPELQRPRDRRPDELGCGELLASTPQILFTNLAAASAMLSTLLLHLGGGLTYCEVCFDIAEGLMRPAFPLDPGLAGPCPPE